MLYESGTWLVTTETKQEEDDIPKSTPLMAGIGKANLVKPEKPRSMLEKLGIPSVGGTGGMSWSWSGGMLRAGASKG